jgi:BolA protein
MLHPVEAVMREKLTAHFIPISLEIIDDSHHHKGHSGAKAGGGTHYTVKLISEQFTGLSRIQRHQAVYAVLAEELKTQIHALVLDVQTPITRTTY